MTKDGLPDLHLNEIEASSVTIQGDSVSLLVQHQVCLSFSDMDNIHQPQMAFKRCGPEKFGVLV